MYLNDEHDHNHGSEDEKSVLVKKNSDSNATHGYKSLCCEEHGHKDHSHHDHQIDHDHHSSSEHGHDCSSHHIEITTTTTTTTPAVTAQSDVNIQAAYLHVVTDTIQSFAVAIAGAIIWWNPEWQIVDPIATFIFSILVLYTTIPLLDRVLKIFMEGVPAHVIHIIKVIYYIIEMF